MPIRPLPAFRSLSRAAGTAAFLIAAFPLAAQQAVPPVPVASAAIKQVDIGGQWFRSRCVECHANNLSDPDFRSKWNGRNAYELFDRMRNTMPDSDPGGLTPETYVALTAYLLKLNGLPVGTSMLSTDSTALASIKLAFPSSLR